MIRVIIDGKEKVIISQEKFGNNLFLIKYIHALYNAQRFKQYRCYQYRYREHFGAGD
jgi:DNA-directed RNA polymerase beta subunit